MFVLLILTGSVTDPSMNDDVPHGTVVPPPVLTMYEEMVPAPAAASP